MDKKSGEFNLNKNHRDARLLESVVRIHQRRFSILDENHPEGIIAKINEELEKVPPLYMTYSGLVVKSATSHPLFTSKWTKQLLRSYDKKYETPDGFSNEEHYIIDHYLQYGRKDIIPPDMLTKLRNNRSRPFAYGLPKY